MNRPLFAVLSCFLAASASAFERSAPIADLRMPAAAMLTPVPQIAALPPSVSAVNAAQDLSPLAPPRAALAPAGDMAAPKTQALASIEASGMIEASAKGGDASALSASSARLFDNGGAKAAADAPVLAASAGSRWRGLLGKAAATASALAAVPALAQAQTQAAPAAGGDSAAAGLIFGGIGLTAFGYMIYESLDLPERRKAKAYLAKNAAALAAIPGVAKVKVETVMTSPWSEGPGVAVYYGLDADRKAIEAAVPPAGEVPVVLMPKFSEKEAARDYVSRFGGKIAAIPGVVDVRADSIFAGYTAGLIAGIVTKPGVRIRYRAGADVKAIEALIPPSVNDVSVVLEPR